MLYFLVNDGGRYPVENNVDHARKESSDLLNIDGLFIEHLL